MDFTSFNKLRRVVAQFGASPVVANLDKVLTGEGIGIDANTDQVVVGDNGIYYVDPRGALTKAVVHIVDKNINDAYSRKLKTSVMNGDFDSDDVLKDTHKYHLMKCVTIERADAGGWRKQKYHMSRKQDGCFFYRFVDEDKVLFPRENQKLYVCKNCLRELERVTEEHYSRESFDLKSFLSSDYEAFLNVDRDGKYADECAPNIYKKDWAKISKTYRGLIKYQCENPDCPCPDLSDTSYRKYLHTHHVSFDKSNNNYSNLKALCIYCHSNQPNHAHIKQLPEYTKYIKLRGLG